MIPIAALCRCMRMSSWDSSPRKEPSVIRLKRSWSKEKRRAVCALILELEAKDLEDIVAAYKELVKSRTGKNSLTDPQEQLWGAVGAVFGSWNNDRAVAYRELYHIPHTWGTAVNVQAMVFGNLRERCATGVAFTQIPRLEKSYSTVSFSSTLREKMSSPASGHLDPSRS